MTSEQEVTIQFKNELRQLLAKWDANLTAEDHYPGYAECGEDIRMSVNIPGRWDVDGNVIRDRTEIDLGCHFDWLPTE